MRRPPRAYSTSQSVRLKQLLMVRSTLRASHQPKTQILSGIVRTILVFNGQFPGPLIRVNVGDRVLVNVTNELTNATTVHWHGMFQNGTNWMDGSTGITQVRIRDHSNIRFFTYLKRQLKCLRILAIHQTPLKFLNLALILIQTVSYPSRKKFSLQFHSSKSIWHLLVSFAFLNPIYRWVGWSIHRPLSRRSKSSNQL